MYEKNFAKQVVKLSVILLSVFQIGMVYAKGPVATNCQKDIVKFCKGVRHDGSVRACLEKNKAKLSTACSNALDTTGHCKARKKCNM